MTTYWINYALSDVIIDYLTSWYDINAVFAWDIQDFDYFIGDDNLIKVVLAPQVFIFKQIIYYLILKCFISRNSLNSSFMI